MKKPLLSAPRVAARILASVWLLALLLSAVLLAPCSALAVTPAVSAGGNHTGALKPDGSLWGWGSNSWGQLGVESLDPLDVPTAVLNGSPFVKQAKGFEHTVAIKADGTLWAWGRNYEGQFGNGTTLPSLQPVLISGFDAPVGSLLAAGERHTLLLKPDGSLWAWGWNAYGQLGDGTQINRSSPVQVQLPADSPVGDKWLAIAAGYKFSLAIRDSDKKLFAWGYNFEGQLGDGTKFNRASPVAVDSPNAWTQVAAGAGHVLAIDAAGQLWSWGSDAYGEMGDDATTDGSLTPVVLPTVSSELWTKVAAGGQHSGAINADGSLWMWGSNNFGQIGDGDGGIGVTQTFPVQVGADSDWIDLVCGDAHTVGLRSNNNLLSWGNNGAGQVGSQVLYGTGAVPDTEVIIADITDVTPPFLTIDTFTYLTNATSQTIGGAVETIDNDVEIWLNGSAIPQGTATLDVTDPANPRWTFLLNGLIAGDNTVRATTLDASSNPTEKSVGIFLDQVKPAVAIAPSFLTNQLTALISGTFTEDQLIGTFSIFSALDAINCIDSVVIDGFTWRCTVDGLSAGPSNPFSVVALDFAGNASNPVVSNIVVDLVAPTAPTVSGTAYTTALRPTWNWISTDASGNDLFRYQLDGGGYVETLATSFTPAVDLAEGSHTLLVQERDAAGNWSLDGAFVIFVDATVPVVSITSPVAAPPTNAPVLVYSASDTPGSGVAMVEVRIDGVLQYPFISSGSSLTLADGLRNVDVRAIDFAGNVSVGASVAFTVDTVPPSLTAPVGINVTATDAFLVLGQVETGATVVISPTSGTGGSATVFPDDSWMYSLTGLAEGSTVVTVTAQDAAGNQTPKPFTVLYDSTPPVVTITSPQNGFVYNSVIPLNYSIVEVNEQSRTVELTGPGGTEDITALTSLDLTEGTYTLTINVMDVAGNANLPATVTFDVNRTLPSLTIDPVVSPTNQSSQTLRGTMISGATVTVTSNTAALPGVIASTATTWECTVRGLVDGVNIFTVTATSAGTPTTYDATIVYDSIPPIVTLTPIATPTNLSNPILYGARDGADTTVTVTTGTTSFPVTYTSGGISWECPLTDLAAGANFISVTGTDTAGNTAVPINTEIFLAGMEVLRSSITDTWSPRPTTLPFKNPVIITGPPTSIDVEPGVVQVRKNLDVVDSSFASFDLRFAEWSNPAGVHVAEDVTTLVLEEGRYPMSDGAIWEVGTFTRTDTQFNANSSFNFTAAFPDTPQLFLTLQSAAVGADPVVVRVRNLTATGFEAALFEAEMRDGVLADTETVGYLAIYKSDMNLPGTATFGSVTRAYNLQNSTHDSTPFDVLTSRFAMEEEQTFDSETTHLAENIAILSFGTQIFIQAITSNEEDPFAWRSLAAVPLVPGVQWDSLLLTPGQWKTISLNGGFTNPVVVVKPLGQENNRAGLVQVRNVGAQSFDVRYGDWNPAFIGTQDVQASFLAVESGVRHDFGSLAIEAGTVGCSGPWPASRQTVNFAPFTTPPAVFASPQTAGGITQVPPPLITRIDAVTTSSFTLGGQGAAAAGDVCSGETLGWIAMQQGLGYLPTTPPRYLMAFTAQASGTATPLNFWMPFGDLVAPTIRGDYVRRYPGIEYSYGRVVFNRYFVNPAPVLIGDLRTAFDTDAVQLHRANLTSSSVNLQLRAEGSGVPSLEDISLLLIE